MLRAALLLLVRGPVDAAVGEEVLVEADHDHVGELESLRRVHRQEGDAARLLLAIVVGAVVEGEALEEGEERPVA